MAPVAVFFLLLLLPSASAYLDFYDDETREGLSWTFVSGEIENVEDEPSNIEPTEGPVSDDQCPCARPPGSSGCAPYNPKYQALNFEEATINFKNTAVEPEVAKTLAEEEAEDDESSSCSKETKPRGGCCQRFLTHIVAIANDLEDEYERNETLRHAKHFKKWCRVSGHDERRHCAQLFSSTADRSDQQLALNPLGNDEETKLELDEVMDHIKGAVWGSKVMPKCEPYKDEPRKLNACQKQLRKQANAKRKELEAEHKAEMERKAMWKHWRKLKHNRGPRRSKRQTSTFNTRSGTSYPVRCSYRRGDDVGDGSGYVGLCNLCWSWRTLPDGYYPSVINELSCDSSDSICLSGYGQCRPRYRSVEVMFNYGTTASPNWVQRSVSATVACECQILSGSVLHNFCAK